MIRAVDKSTSKKTAALFRALAQPSRVRILLAIGQNEACVCHLESALGQRQAYISQQLMALREAGLVIPRREGRNIFYSLSDQNLLVLLQQAGRLLGFSAENMMYSPAGEIYPSCPCPHCTLEDSCE